MSAQISGNTVNVTLPPGRMSTKLSVTAGSTDNQYVTITGGVTGNISGSGHSAPIGDISLPDSNSSELKFTIKFEYETGGKRKACTAVEKGGPYSIRNIHFFMLASENGDDNDFNDCVVNMSWKT